MLINIIHRIIGTKSDRVIKRYQHTVRKINILSQTYSNMTDEMLMQQTAIFRQRISEGETLDDLIPDAFAAVSEAASRAIQQKPFNVQLIGALALHHGHIAEMRTGEGKTLTATLAAYLNTLNGKSVHIVTVNPYLAERDAQWMSKVFEKLATTVGCIIPGQSHQEKLLAYSKNIIYGTNHELGYDYLRDNMVSRIEDRVMSELNYVIVDEADSVLIDEARTPLMISGSIEDSSELYNKLIPLVDKLDIGENGHLLLDEKERTAQLTEHGIDLIENRLSQHALLKPNSSIYDTENISLLHYIDSCLRAQYLYRNNVDYLIKDGEILIIDESTGRTLTGRRWSQGLHQAIEAKEGLKVNPESQTLASITFQNFFRLYKKLSGMTGTAATEKEELRDIYGLDVLTIPTHKPMIRKDHADLIFLNQQDKYEAICKDIAERHETGQPVLVGTPSVEASEFLSNELARLGIPHQVLSAKQHEKEAKVIAQAGCLKTVTISANMAGRGTDIILGGDPQKLNANGKPLSHENWLKSHNAVKKLGGLHVIGTERNESRRADNQILGRAGRQGDPGSSQFYLSLDDPLIRIFASERVGSLMRTLGMKPKEHIQSPILNRAINNAQHKVEQYHYDIRKNLLKYDDIANDQRQLIYNERDMVMHPENIPAILDAIIDNVLSYWIEENIPEHVHHEWELTDLEAQLSSWNIHTDLNAWLIEQTNVDRDKLKIHLRTLVDTKLRENTHHVNEDQKLRAYSSTMLHVIDRMWKDHLAMTDHLRQGIHLRTYAQKNPAHEFTRECFDLFYAMLGRLKENIAYMILNLTFETPKKSINNPLPNTYNTSSNRTGSYRIVSKDDTEQ